MAKKPEPESVEDSERVARLSALLKGNRGHKLLREGVDAHLGFWELAGRDTNMDRNPAAVALGALGGTAGKGKTGVRKGFAAMAPERLRKIAMEAAAAKREKRAENLK